MSKEKAAPKPVATAGDTAVIEAKVSTPARTSAAKSVPKKVLAKAPETKAKNQESAKEVVNEAKPEPEEKPKTTKEKAASKKVKLVRDSFTMPENEYALFSQIKQRAIKAGKEVKKSEVLRAAVVALAELSDDALLTALDAIERIKTGRPKK